MQGEESRVISLGVEQTSCHERIEDFERARSSSHANPHGWLRDQGFPQHVQGLAHQTSSGNLIVREMVEKLRNQSCNVGPPTLETYELVTIHVVR